MGPNIFKKIGNSKGNLEARPKSDYFDTYDVRRIVLNMFEKQELEIPNKFGSHPKEKEVSKSISRKHSLYMKKRNIG